MKQALICDAIRTPFGRYGGSLAQVRTDDLAATPVKALMARYPRADWAALDDVLFGCANQAGEDNRNVARMALLLAGMPVSVSAATLNRLCGSSLDAIGTAARAIKSGEADFMLAGGVESMTRAPFVMPKAGTAFTRDNAVYDTTIGWRFVNPAFQAAFGTDSMPETAENVAQQYDIDRESQDRFACESHARALAAQAAGHFEREITSVLVPQRKGDSIAVTRDEHPRQTTMETLARLRGVVKPDGTVTAGNSSGVNDGAGCVLLASEAAATHHGLTARARIIGMATAGVEPRIMGMGPVPAVRKLLRQTGIALETIDVIELNEAFASQSLAVLRELGIADTDPRVNGWGGAIALGHPLGASGARLVGTALNRLENIQGRYALCTMCVGVGQGVALLFERL